MKPLSLSRPHLIIMIGIPGSGKSFFGEHFAETFKAPVINYGRIHKELFGSVSDDKSEEQIVQRAAQLLLRELFKTNQSIIYEGPTATRTARTVLAKVATAAGYVPLFVWVQTESAEANRRATKQTKETVALTAEQFEQALRKFSVPLASEGAIVISGKHTYASQLKIVLKHLASAREAKLVIPERPAPHRNILIR